MNEQDLSDARFDTCMTRLQAARITLCDGNLVVWGALNCALKDVPCWDVPTACTNGKVIKWAIPWVETLSNPELVFVLAHETAHCALGHLWRFAPGNEVNDACDLVINRELRKLCFYNPLIKMPIGGLDNPNFDDLCEEEILEILRKKPQQPQPGGNGKPQPQPGQGGQGAPGQPEEPGKPQPGDCGKFEEPASSEEPGEKPLQEQWAVTMAQAVQAARLGRAHVPDCIDRMYADATAVSPVDWRAETVEFLRNCVSQSRPDYRRAARRHATAATLTPRREQRTVGRVIIARDTSGSISDGVCAAFGKVVSSVQAELQCAVTLIDCDSRIHQELEITPGEPLPEPKGGGGTDFSPVFDRVEKLAVSDTICGIIYLTDLDGDMPAHVPSVPVLWVSTWSDTVPFGRVVRISRHEVQA